MDTTAWIRVTQKIKAFSSQNLFGLISNFLFELISLQCFAFWGIYQYVKSCYLVIFGCFCTFLVTLESLLSGSLQAASHEIFWPETFAYSFLTMFKEKARLFRVGYGGDFFKYRGYKVGEGPLCPPPLPLRVNTYIQYKLYR